MEAFPFPWWGNFLPSQQQWNDCLPVGHSNNEFPWESQWPQNPHPNNNWQCEALTNATVDSLVSARKEGSERKKRRKKRGGVFFIKVST